jgi:hypothetical protein
VSASWTQRSRFKDQECVAVSSKLPLGSANMVAKKEEKKKRKKKKEKRER